MKTMIPLVLLVLSLITTITATPEPKTYLIETRENKVDTVAAQRSDTVDDSDAKDVIEPETFDDFGSAPAKGSDYFYWFLRFG